MANSLHILSPDKIRDEILSEPREATMHEENYLNTHKMDSEHRITL